MAMGRPQKPYVTQDGTIVQGLYRCPDGRWRVNATGQKFTEADEFKAVTRFRQITGTQPVSTTPVEVTLKDVLPDAPARLDDLTGRHAGRLTEFYDAAGELDDSG